MIVSGVHTSMQGQIRLPVTRPTNRARERPSICLVVKSFRCYGTKWIMEFSRGCDYANSYNAK